MSDTDTADTGAGVPKRPSPVVGYILKNPVSVALALVLVITGLVFGTFWGQFPDDLAAGVVTTGKLAMWWTPVTALLVPGSLIEAILTIAVTLTVMAYAERKLGSLRTVIVFFVGGALATLAGVGAEALAVGWDEEWALIGELDRVLDPAIGVFAVIMAGSALAPALFRRRIRVIGFTLLIMFVLYAGDTDSIMRLIGAAIGLCIGLMLARDAALHAWRHSSMRETRTLIAAIVAVTGLGPLIVLISGVGNGPLALAVTGFTPVDVGEIVDRCSTDFSAACSSDLALATTSGPGAFVLSIIPLVLALIAAWGLRTGRRSAWILALVVNAAVALLTIAALGADEVLDPKAVDIVGVEYASWVVAAALVPIAMIVLLLVTRRRFQVRAPRTAVRRFAATVGGAFVVVVAAFTILTVTSPQDFIVQPTIAETATGLVRLFVPPGFLAGYPAAAVPVDGLALFVFEWIGVAFWVVVIVMFLFLYRATASTRSHAEADEYRALLKRGGGGTLGFMGTWPGNDYWFTAARDGGVAYRVINGVALTMSDPVCAEGRDAEVIHDFVEFCDHQGWTAVFYSFHERYAPVFDSFGWQRMSVGEETVLQLADLEIAGKPWQKVRQAMNRAVREGITTVWSTWDDLPPALSAQIQAISEEWVSEKELPEMGFTLGGMEEVKDPDVYLYLAVDGQEKVQAITSWMPSWTDGAVSGWTIDFMRRGDDSMNGVMEFIIASAALRMKEEGAQVLSLSGAPLAEKPVAPGEQAPEPTIMTGLLGWLGTILEPAYGFSSLFKYKSKFNPEYQTIYMAYADPAALPAIGMAIGKAYLPHATTSEYLALVKTLTAPRG